jgi:hypothetical protein
LLLSFTTWSDNTSLNTVKSQYNDLGKMFPLVITLLFSGSSPWTLM